MTDLSGAGVRVLLIATGTHDGPTLPSVPSVSPTFQALRTALIEQCGVPSDQLREVLDPPDAKTMAQAVAEEAHRADTVLLVYFIGHGLLDVDGELYLAARSTDRLIPGMAGHQALSFSALRQALTASPASSIVLVLDCCFSGRPALGRGASVPAFSMDPAPGLYFIGSAEQLALAPPGAERTAFTGALVDVLTQGDPRGPHQLTLDLVYDAVFRTMRDQQLPLPRRQAEGRSGNLVVAANPAVPVQTEPRKEPEPAPGRCPYPGLNSFGPEDARLFCGREGMIERVLSAMEECADTPAMAGPLVLVGPSGSGKTSLLNAGLVTRLRDDGLPSAAGWTILRLTPGTRPLRRLAEQFDMPTDSLRILREVPERVNDWVDRLLTDRPGQRLVVLVDQLEELFTLCRDEAERSAFLRALTSMATPLGDSPPRTCVILALRADFYGQAAAQPDLLAALRDRQLLVEPMTSDELRAAIEQPADRTGLRLDDGLADLMLHEFGAMDGGRPTAGALPLLSHTLWATWRQCAGSHLTVAGYRATGGISQAIAHTADTVYDALSPTGQEAVKHMLPRLVRVGEDLADMSQPMDRSALLHGLPDSQAAQDALDQFTEARLITVDQDTARISHEALIRAWPLLREWVDADRDWLRDRQQLADDATAWERFERDPSLLYRGNRLAALRQRAEAASTHAKDLDPLLAEFVDTSTRQERRGARRRRIAVAFLAVLALLASVGLGASVVFQQQAAQAHERDLARYVAAEAENLRANEPGLAKQLSLISYRINHEAGKGALMNSQRSPGVINAQDAAYDLAYNADGRVLVISTGDSIVLRTRSDSAQIKANAVGPVTVSSDGRTLAAVTYDNRQPTTRAVKLWDISAPAHPRQTAALKVQHTTSIALSTDGKTLFAGVSTGEILLWDIGDRAAPAALPTLREHSAQVDSLAVSPRRNLLASISVDGRVQLWNVADARRPSRIGTLKAVSYTRAVPTLSTLHRVAFDRTGRLLAAPVSVMSTDRLGLWKLDDPSKPRQMSQGQEASSPGSCLTDRLTSLTFSPDRDHIVGVCGTTWQAWLYSTTSKSDLIKSGTSMTGPGDALGTGPVLFDPDNTRKLLQATSRGVLVWYVSNVAQLGASENLPLETAAFGGRLALQSNGKKQLLALQGVGRNYLVDVTDWRKNQILAAIPGPTPFMGADIRLSPNGRILADVELGKRDEKKNTEDFGLRLRDTTHPTGAPLATIGGDDLHNGAAAIAFSPTKPLLAVSDLNAAYEANQATPLVRLFDIADPRHPRQIAQIRTTSFDIAFSPDGKALLTDDSPINNRKNPGPTARIQLKSWDLTDPAHPTELWSQRLAAGVDSAYPAFRPDGKVLAVYQSSGTLLLWHLDQHRPTGSPISVTIDDHGGPIAFTPDGTRVALFATRTTSRRSDDGERPEIWDLTDPNDPTLESYLPATSAGDLYSLAFSPDGRQLAVARDAGVDLWDISPKPIIDNLCNSVGDPITPKQWRRYLPDRPYEPPCQ
ncbi:AAA family ATPase [Streptomyces olivoreticuli]